jgi:hypothetical protein
MISLHAVTPALAQDIAVKAEAKKTPAASLTKRRFVSPQGYTLVPPKGWTGHSKYVPDGEVERLSEYLKAQIKSEKVEALFVRSDPRGVATARDANIVVVRAPIAIGFDKESLIAFRRDVLDFQFSRFYERYEITEYNVLKLGGRSVINVEMMAHEQDISMYQRQLYISFKSELLMINCTAYGAMIKPVRAVCEAVAASVKFQ